MHRFRGVFQGEHPKFTKTPRFRKLTRESAFVWCAGTTPDQWGSQSCRCPSRWRYHVTNLLLDRLSVPKESQSQKNRYVFKSQVAEPQVWLEVLTNNRLKNRRQIVVLFSKSQRFRDAKFNDRSEHVTGRRGGQLSVLQNGYWQEISFEAYRGRSYLAMSLAR